MSASPVINDTKHSLLVKICQNWYDYGVLLGVTGINPPSWNDTDDVLLKKIAYTTAKIIDAS
jgi:hypothetical protein